MRYIRYAFLGGLGIVVLFVAILAKFLDFGLTFSMVYHISYKGMSLAFCLLSGALAVLISTAISQLILFGVMPHFDWSQIARVNHQCLQRYGAMLMLRKWT